MPEKELLSIRLLGPPEVGFGGRRPRFGRKEALALLCYLAAGGGKRSGRHLADGHIYGANRPGAEVSQGLGDALRFQSEQASLKNAYECIKVFSQIDLTEDLKRIGVPEALIVHGDDDQIVPIVASAHRSSKPVKNATPKVYEGGPHGLPPTHKDRLDEGLLAFLKA